MPPPSGTVEISVTFPSTAEAEAAANALREAGIPASSLDLQHNVLPEAREGRFVSRVLVIIVLWTSLAALSAPVSAGCSLRP